VGLVVPFWPGFDLFCLCYYQEATRIISLCLLMFSKQFHVTWACQRRGGMIFGPSLVKQSLFVSKIWSVFSTWSKS